MTLCVHIIIITYKKTEVEEEDKNAQSSVERKKQIRDNH
jgi:hypothetical protein